MRKEKLPYRTVTTLDSHIEFKSGRSHKPLTAPTEHDLIFVYPQGTICGYRHLRIADKKKNPSTDASVHGAGFSAANHSSPFNQSRSPPQTCLEFQKVSDSAVLKLI
jgi:hypothetical protein